ncbi:cation diffusion facilitator family transporter [Paenarthrobacter nicotinovorans]|uniref:cation diffusion facilitator family transporter n=1 Tax=Paenarthrobacter nicotinovorans TaxID=29320 RepID=UPI00166781F3|nr:cation transporter [Paenarthrobacter nicotinovorans]MBP2394242.1 cation diffusion facilitator family transporter [Paenarthrobacter nicotinovorans]UKE99551.1 cation transporter [Paenarthrobacter nicotinovorans]UKF04335.1 cation transporter [Paenarthrobacter nicotinovorans]GGV39121.1 cation diffusion facilitator transporter [Paenarthrobacter nicotinovorans]
MAASRKRSDSSSTLLTVVIAFAANALVAAAKSVAAALTGSASMTAEAAHSWADTGNQVFLFLAERRSQRPRDTGHPMGYGREAYVWSMFAAFGLFTAGAVVSIMHGIQQIIEPEPASDFLIAYVVLAVAFVLEGFSFVQAFRQTRKAARKLERRTLEQVLVSSDPTLRAVFAEDAAALAGLVIAFTGVFLHQVTGSPLPDAVGSIVVGVLLAVVAVVLIDRNRRFLVGQGVTPDIERSMGRQLLEHPDIARLTYLHLEFVGPRRLYLVAAVDLQGDHPEHEVAVVLRRIERELEDHETVEEAVLTLATPDESSLQL